MSEIVFFDLEVSREDNKIKDFGGINDKGEKLHTRRFDLFKPFIEEASFVCGHNIIRHDLVYLKRLDKDCIKGNVIDTLMLSPLLFPKRPYHHLVKDDKLHTDQLNNPLNDAISAKDLFFDAVTAFQKLDLTMQSILRGLLLMQPSFQGFFAYINKGQYTISHDTERAHSQLKMTISHYFRGHLCEHANLDQLIIEHPIELAYCLVIIRTGDRNSVTPRWVGYQFPEVETVIKLLRHRPCLVGCAYCAKALDPVRGLKIFFGFDAYRTYDGEALQENAVKAAVDGKSLLAIFPTGGGKSITFQVPALMAGQATRGLTVVLSPLQSLMKDQVDNLEGKGIIDAVAINGLLDPIERSKAIERVEDGSAKLLYLSPESLRSKTMERLLLSRKIERFVIDEAHCFSVWGQDFRVDYLYIGPFIKNYCAKKQLTEMIPVSCFTATAKQNVVTDIQNYFREQLGLELELFTAHAARKNLTYKVIPCHDVDKYEQLRRLIMQKNCSTIVYVSKTRKAEALAERLCQDGLVARAYHGQMDKKIKSENQEQFTSGEVDIMVATSAFGMGVDKPDVGLVIHYQISNSLENYVQEAGRAGRDERIEADCFILYDDEDLNEHFTMLNQSKLNMVEIGQIWKAIKDITRTRKKVSQSALEIARKAGWDEGLRDIETRVKTAIAALEQAGYVRRGQNVPKVFADSILSESVIDASERIRASKRFADGDEQLAIRIIQKLISAKHRKGQLEYEAESRVEYISDQLGILNSETIRIVNLLKEEKLLADSKDLTVYLNEDTTRQKSYNLLKWHLELEDFLFEVMTEDGVYNIKELNESAEEKGLTKVSTDKIITLLNYWAIKRDVKKQVSSNSKNHIKMTFQRDYELLVRQFKQREKVAHFVLAYLFEKGEGTAADKGGDENYVQFSVLELKEAYEFENQLFREITTVQEIEDSLFYLTRIGAMKIEGGFLVLYNGLSIERLEMDNRIQYKTEDYKQLKTYYEQKVHQVHIVGEYARKMLENYEAALRFVDDYFTLNYQTFLRKYFKGPKGEEMLRNITPEKFRQLFGTLSPDQLAIVNDQVSKYIVVAAGPGSGKTRILVHKLAALLLMEDVKHEQLLMVTFSRAAATEFKKRLKALIGLSANYVDIKTFHGYCFDLLGRVGDIDKSANIIEETAQLIIDGEVEISRITKTVMVIDEAQDMNEHEFNFVRAMVKCNENIRIIAVGDDDQNIYAFRGSSSDYMKRIGANPDAKTYELVENYRSKANLVAYTNQYATLIPNRMKTVPIFATQQSDGVIARYYYMDDRLKEGIVNMLNRQGAKGSVCVMTFTNDEALQMVGYLNDMGYQARLIQSTEEIRLQDLDEVRFIENQVMGHESIEQKMPLIDDETWLKAKRNLKLHYGRSDYYDICIRMMSDFELVTGKYRYATDFIYFIRESKIEDFLETDMETIQVSTMHKAKGREFDTVILALDGFLDATSENKRVLYVAMTRAKEQLLIHERITKQAERVAETSAIYETAIDLPPKTYNRLILQLGHKDIYLSFFYNKNICQLMENVRSGDSLKVTEKGCYLESGEQILVFSKAFKERLRLYEKQGYSLHSAKVNAVLYWKSEDHEDETKVLMPMVKLVEK